MPDLDKVYEANKKGEKMRMKLYFWWIFGNKKKNHLLIIQFFYFSDPFFIHEKQWEFRYNK
jgi:hypothetical protein